MPYRKGDRHSFGFGKRFGVSKGPFKKSRSAKTGARVMNLKHKGPKGTRKGKIAFFRELGGSGQSGLRGRR